MDKEDEQLRLDYNNNHYCILDNLISDSFVSFFDDYINCLRDTSIFHLYENDQVHFDLVDWRDPNWPGMDERIETHQEYLQYTHKAIFQRYGDTFAEILLIRFKDRLEKILQEKLIPTYSYIRVYENNSIMEEHIDRPACEVSITLNVSSVPENKEWPIYMAETPLNLRPGQAVMYSGCDIRHRREAYDGETYTQCFFHYIKESSVKKDPRLKQFILDGRRQLSTRRLPNIQDYFFGSMYRFDNTLPKPSAFTTNLLQQLREYFVPKQIRKAQKPHK